MVIQISDIQSRSATFMVFSITQPPTPTTGTLTWAIEKPNTTGYEIASIEPLYAGQTSTFGISIGGLEPGGLHRVLAEVLWDDFSSDIALQSFTTKTEAPPRPPLFTYPIPPAPNGIIIYSITPTTLQLLAENINGVRAHKLQPPHSFLTYDNITIYSAATYNDFAAAISSTVGAPFVPPVTPGTPISASLFQLLATSINAA